MLAESTKKFDQNQLQLVQVGQSGPGQEFRANLATFSKFLSTFLETKWLEVQVTSEFTAQKQLAMKLMSDLQVQRQRCQWCQMGQVGYGAGMKKCSRCGRCPCGYTGGNFYPCCGHFQAWCCSRCGQLAGGFCARCNICKHGYQKPGSTRIPKKGKKDKTQTQTACPHGCESEIETQKTTLVSDSTKLDKEAGVYLEVEAFGFLVPDIALRVQVPKQGASTQNHAYDS